METTVGKKVDAKATSPVFITKIRRVGLGTETYQLELRQKFQNQVTNTSQLLNIAMEGHSAFSNADRTRVCWQNFSKKQCLEGFGLSQEILTLADNAPAEAKGYQLPQPIVFTWNYKGSVLEAKLVETDNLVPRAIGIDMQTGEQRMQEPKKAGQNGEVLTYNNQPIYRNIAIAVRGAGINMEFEDTIISHNNAVQGSTLRSRAAGAMAPGAPASAVRQ